MCFSESSLDYTALHGGKYRDVCGVTPWYWYQYLKEQGIPTNSILGGYTVYQYYLDKTESSTKALKEFKGIESKKNYWIVHKVQRVMKEIKKKHLKEN